MKIIRFLLISITLPLFLPICMLISYSMETEEFTFNERLYYVVKIIYKIGT